MRRERGFSLVELIVAVGLIAVLVAVAMPSITSYIGASARMDTLTFERSLNRSIVLYSAMRGEYPPQSALGQGLRYFVEEVLYPVTGNRLTVPEGSYSVDVFPKNAAAGSPFRIRVGPYD